MRLSRRRPLARPRNTERRPPRTVPIRTVRPSPHVSVPHLADQRRSSRFASSSEGRSTPSPRSRCQWSVLFAAVLARTAASLSSSDAALPTRRSHPGRSTVAWTVQAGSNGSTAQAIKQCTSFFDTSRNFVKERRGLPRRSSRDRSLARPLRGRRAAGAHWLRGRCVHAASTESLTGVRLSAAQVRAD